MNKITHYLTLEAEPHVDLGVGVARPLGDELGEMAFKVAGGGWNEDQTINGMQIHREMQAGNWRLESARSGTTWAIAAIHPTQEAAS